MTATGNTGGKTEKEFRFEIQLNWLEKKRSILSAKDVKDTIRVALPKQFGGEGEEWSPEHLFLGSLSSCFMTTLFAIAGKMKLEISHYQCQAIGQIENVNGKYEFTIIDLYPKISVPDENLKEKAYKALERTQDHCLVSNSIRSRIVYHSEVLKDKVLLHKNESEFCGL